MNESGLAVQAGRGDSGAWETLVNRHREAVFRLAYLLVGDADDAQDVAQETFIRAFRSFHRYDPTRPLRPWLLRITSNLARNRRRSVGRYLAALQRLLHAAPAPGWGDPAGKSASQEESRLLWQAVRRLDTADQEIIYLRYFLELPVAETAEVLQIAPGTVKSRLNRATGRLRLVVEREFPGLGEERQL